MNSASLRENLRSVLEHYVQGRQLRESTFSLGDVDPEGVFEHVVVTNSSAVSQDLFASIKNMLTRNHPDACVRVLLRLNAPSPRAGKPTPDEWHQFSKVLSSALVSYTLQSRKASPGEEYYLSSDYEPRFEQLVLATKPELVTQEVISNLSLLQKEHGPHWTIVLLAEIFVSPGRTMPTDQDELDGEELYTRLVARLRTFGKSDAFGKGDYWVKGDWGRFVQEVYIFNARIFNMQLVDVIQQVLRPDFERWVVTLRMEGVSGESRVVPALIYARKLVDSSTQGEVQSLGELSRQNC